MNRQITANRAPKLVSVTYLPATMATASRAFTSATEITTVWIIPTKTTDTSAATASATLKRNSPAAPTNNGVR